MKQNALFYSNHDSAVTFDNNSVLVDRTNLLQGSWREVKDRTSVNDITTDGESEFPATVSNMSRADMVSAFEGQVMTQSKQTLGTTDLLSFNVSHRTNDKPPRIKELDRQSTMFVARSPSAQKSIHLQIE